MALALVGTLEADQTPWEVEDLGGGTYHATWEGAAERTYFLQWSLDLHSWKYAPVMAFGEGAQEGFVEMSGVPKIFLRLLYMDDTGAESLAQAKELDFDGDTIPNAFEVQVVGSDPLDGESMGDDSDGDGLPDGWELYYFNNLDQDGSGDPDGDGKLNSTEFLFRTEPVNMDSDGDGLPRAWEIAHGTDPDFADSGAPFQDSGLTNLQAFQAGVQAAPNAKLTNLDGDSSENQADADPNDGAVDWRRGPDPAFVVNELDLGEEDLDKLELNDLGPDGSLLFNKIDDNFSTVGRLLVDNLGIVHSFAVGDPQGDGNFGSTADQLFDGGRIVGDKLMGDHLVEGVWNPIGDAFVPDTWRSIVGYYDQIRDQRNGITLYRGNTALLTMPGKKALPGEYARESSSGSIEENGNIVSNKAYWRRGGDGYADGVKLPSPTNFQSATLEQPKAAGGAYDKWNLVPTTTGLMISKNGAVFKRAKGSLGSGPLQAATNLGWVFKTDEGDGVTQVWSNGEWRYVKDLVSNPEDPYLEFKALKILDTGLGIWLVQKDGKAPKLALVEPAVVRVSNVTFSQGTDVLNDDGTAMVAGGDPQWVDLKNNSNPAEALPDGLPDKADPPKPAPNDVMSYAYSYVSNKKPKVAAIFQWLKPPPSKNAPYSASGKVVDTPNCSFVLAKRQLTNNFTTYPGLVADKNVVDERKIQGYVSRSWGCRSCCKPEAGYD